MNRLERWLPRRKASVTSAGVVLAMGASVTMWPHPDARLQTAAVRRGTFVETLVERGTIDAARVTLYVSTIAGSQAKILEIVPEGTAVSAGDVLVRFDAAPFEELVARAEAAQAQADAELLRAQEDLRLEAMRADSDVEAARDQEGAAERTLASERDGKGPLAIAESEAAASEAARELARAKTSFEDTQALLKDGFATRMEVDRAEQALRQAEDRQRLATLRLATLRRFEQPAAVDQARAQLGAARKSVGAATETARSKLAQRRAAVALAAARAADARLRLANARAHVERTTLRAATSGLIVYRELFFGTDRRKPQPGDEVWPNQPLVAVPDPANLIVQTRVREIDLHRIFTSQRVTAFVDAYPGLRLPATVGLIGALAQEDASRAGTRFFPVTIRLAQADARLRTGMTARVEIEVSRQPDVTLVPVEALIEEDGAIRCRVARGPRLEMRDVEVAARNDTVAWIRRGLSAGEMVVTADLTRTER